MNHCRLHSYGMGIHLLQRGSDSDSNAASPPPAARPPLVINPKDNHISFQVTTADSEQDVLQIRRPCQSTANTLCHAVHGHGAHEGEAEGHEAGLRRG